MTFWPATAHAESTNQAAAFRARAERVYVEAKARYEASPTNDAVAIAFGRACFDCAEFPKNDGERASLAVQGISACRRALERTPDSGSAHYYLAMNLGQLARTKILGALSIVDEMEDEFKRARALDSKLDFAGPDRNLGELYLEAPGWPASIGSKTKARQHLKHAIEIAPDYPGNRLKYAEALVRWKDWDDAKEQLKLLEQILPAARTNLSGEAWSPSWVEWDERIQAAKKKIEEH